MKRFLLSVLTLTALGASAQLPANPLMVYEFTNASLTNTSSSGAGNLVGSVTGTGDRYGNVFDAADLSGTLDGGSLGNSNVTNTLLSFWIKSTSISNSIDILNMYGGDNNGYTLRMDGSAIYLDLKIGTDASPIQQTLSTNQEVDDNIWHNIMVRTTLSGTMSLVVDVYVDGVGTSILGASVTNGTIINSLFNYDASLVINPYGSYGDDFDDVYVYDRFVDDTEMTNLYNYSTAGSANVSEVNQEIELTTYPNPTTGNVTFNTTEQINSIEVYSLAGQKVSVFNNTNTIDISNLTKGMYMAKVTVGNTIKTIKLIKE